MPTPIKPYLVLQNEKKSHRTKAELKMRQQGEAALTSGSYLSEFDEVKNNNVAHEEFIRITSILKSIDKNDGLYSSVINRYCMLYAECIKYDDIQRKLCDRLSELYQQDMEFLERVTLEMSIQDKIMKCDTKIMQKRAMMLCIEKENIMTIASALRSIPKKEEKKNNKLLEALGNG